VFHVKLAPDLICKAAGIDCLDEKRLALSQSFCGLVWKANSKINLVSRRGDVAREIERQFLLSMAALDLIEPAKRLNWLDIGSGGGFPGIPLAIFRPDISFVLVESIAKKAFFLERTIEALTLPNVSVTQERLTTVGPSQKVPHHSFDWVSVKAVAEWETSLQWGDSFLKPSGCLLTYKPILVRAAESRALAKHGFNMLSSTPIIDKLPEAGLHIFVLRKSDKAK
jgi:16S rRNA (guanine(527)-N(7))-methyltransferase RsmG